MEDTNTTIKTPCQNCDEDYEEGFQFCPHCGQQTEEDLTVGVLFYNTISNYFSFDARFLRSFLPLMFKPGVVAKRFVEGKRLKYLHPAQYYLFVSVIFFFILSFKVREYNNAANKALKSGFETTKKQEPIAINPLDSTDVANITNPIINNPLVTSSMSEEDRKVLDSALTKELSKSNSKPEINLGYDTKKLDSLIAAGASEEEQLRGMGMKEDAGFFQRTILKQLIKFHKNEGGGIVQAFFDTIPVALFFLLPIFALILKVFYWRRGRFAHHLVFSFYYFSFLFIVLGLIIGINQWLYDIPDWLDWLIMLSTFFYLWISMKRFYDQGYFITFIKASMSTFIYMLFIVPMALGIIALASFVFY